MSLFCNKESLERMQISGDMFKIIYFNPCTINYVIQISLSLWRNLAFDSYKVTGASVWPLCWFSVHCFYCRLTVALQALPPHLLPHCLAVLLGNVVVQLLSKTDVRVVSTFYTKYKFEADWVCSAEKLAKFICSKSFQYSY